MGINLQTATFLHSERDRGVNFERLLCLGRQSLHVTSAEYCGLGLGEAFADPYLAAHELFKSLGAKSIDSIDHSSYEGANIIHDLNKPFKPNAGQTWSCVFDGGSLEHVFNFPIAVKTCLEITAVGGTFISVTPWSGLAGHGFYQFCPELFYRIFSENNGFRMNRMLFYRNGGWYTVDDPECIGRRLEFQSKRPLLLCVSARKTSEKPIFSDFPQQSDYEVLWSTKAPTRGVRSTVPSRLSKTLKTFCPVWATDIRRRFWQRQVRLSLVKRTNL